jgi:hypothetical protein
MMKKQSYEHIIKNIPLYLRDIKSTLTPSGDIKSTLSGVDILPMLEDIIVRRIFNGQYMEKLGFISLVYPGHFYDVNYIKDMIFSYKYLPDVGLVGKGCVLKKGKNNIMNKDNEQIYTDQLHPHTFVYSLKGDTSDRRNILLHIRKTLGENINNINIRSFSTDFYQFII